MNVKKMTIMAVAAMMLLSYPFLAITSYEADADPSQGAGVEYFGYGGTLGAGQLYEFVADDFGDDLVIPGKGQIDIEDSLEALLGDDDAEDLLEDGRMDAFLRVALLGKGYVDIDVADMDATGEVWSLYTRGPSGISISSAVKADVTVDIDAGRLDGSRLIVDDGSMTLISHRNIEASLDGDGMLRSVYTSASTFIRVDALSNLEYDRDIIVGESQRTIDIDTAFRTDSSIEFTEPVDLSTVKNRTVDVPAIVSIDQGMTSNTVGSKDIVVNSSVPMTMRLMFDDDEFEMRNISHDADALRVDSLLPDLEFEFEDVDDIPTQIMPGRILKLTGERADAIEDRILSIRDGAYDAMGNLKVTVTYVDGTGAAIDTRDVGYGETIPFVTYDGDVPAGKVFVDWTPMESVTLRNTFIAMGDVTMVPVFAAEIRDATDTVLIAQTLAGGDNVLLTVALGSDLDVPLTGVDVDIGLIIDVVDGDRKVARWTIIGDTAGCASSVTVEVSQSGTVPDSMDGVDPLRLSFEASGKMPAGTIVSYNVSDTYGDGVTVEVFHVESDGRNVLVGRSLVDDGFVDIPAHHFSDYILQGDPSSYRSGDGGSNTLVIVAGVAIAAIVVVGAVMYLRRS